MSVTAINSGGLSEALDLRVLFPAGEQKVARRLGVRLVAQPERLPLPQLSGQLDVRNVRLDGVAIVAPARGSTPKWLPAVIAVLCSTAAVLLCEWLVACLAFLLLTSAIQSHAYECRAVGKPKHGGVAVKERWGAQDLGLCNLHVRSMLSITHVARLQAS